MRRSAPLSTIRPPGPGPTNGLPLASLTAHGHGWAHDHGPRPGGCTITARARVGRSAERAERLLHAAPDRAVDLCPVGVGGGEDQRVPPPADGEVDVALVHQPAAVPVGVLEDVGAPALVGIEALGEEAQPVVAVLALDVALPRGCGVLQVVGWRLRLDEEAPVRPGCAEGDLPAALADPPVPRDGQGEATVGV